MATKSQQNAKPSSSHHFIRTFFSSIIGSLALLLIILSIITVWINRTVTDTNTYVKTVAPLVLEADVQNFVVSKASEALLDNNDAPIRDIANELLTPNEIAGKTDEQLRTEIRPIIEESLSSVITSQSFANIWESNNRSIHTQLIFQLESDADEIKLDFHPLITGAIDQLKATKLAFVTDKLDIPVDAGQVTLEDKQLSNFRNVYDLFNKAMLALLIAAVAAVGLSVLISVHHLKTIRRISLLTGLFSAILAMMLSATSLISTGGDELDKKMGIALVNGVTHDLRLSLIVIAVVGIGGAVGSKVYSVIKARKTPSTKS